MTNPIIKGNETAAVNPIRSGTRSANGFLSN